MYIEIIIYQFSYHDLFIIYFYNDQIVLQMYLINASKKDDKDQETVQSSTTPNPGYLMGK